MNLESDTASPLVEIEKGGFGEWKRRRVAKRFYWNLIFLFVFDETSMDLISDRVGLDGILLLNVGQN